MHIRSLLLAAAALSLATSQLAWADPPADLIAPGAEVKKLADGFAFTEGPAADSEGNVYFTDIPNERILRWSTDGKLTTFREQSGRANGLYFDKQGNLLACEGGARRLALISADGKHRVLADKYEGKQFNSPNDLWIAPDGGIYFTDPRYGSEEDRELDGYWVFHLAPGADKVARVIDDLVKPNGIIGTADGKRLYVADPGAKKTYSYRINEDGTLSGKQLFCESGSDGMTLDEHGNLYLTSGAVLIFDPAGKRLGEIKTPVGPANVTFGGADGKTLFITARKGLYAIPMQVKGQ